MEGSEPTRERTKASTPIGSLRHVTVYLVGAGPGDPKLITVRGAELLRSCDVVVHDRLSGSALLELVPSTAEVVNVGKAPGNATMEQADINALLVERGLAGLDVVRLKGGDPFVFARGAEEALALAEAGVPFEIVPGVTSAIAAPAAAGIPVTMRSEVLSFTVVTGHESPSTDGTPASIDWDAIASTGGTIVILMAAARMVEIAERLQRGGLAADTPVAAIRWATTDRQEVVRGTLATVAAMDIKSPSTVVVSSLAAVDLLA